MKQSIYLFLFLFFLASCDSPIYNLEDGELQCGGSLTQVVDSCKIYIEPTTLKVNDNIAVTINHLENKHIPVIFSSKSLNFCDTVVTPISLTKQASIVGSHDLNFTIYHVNNSTVDAETLNDSTLSITINQAISISYFMTYIKVTE
jgi:hypothetical protein